MGSGGLFVVAFLDSSILSFPFVTDALVIELSVQKPSRMPLYAAMAVLGSLAGCVWIYLLAKKGGEAFFEKRAGIHGQRTRRWVDQNAFATMFISSILPPPLPLFKVVVLAEGVFQSADRHVCESAAAGARCAIFRRRHLWRFATARAALTFLQAHRLAFAFLGTSRAGDPVRRQPDLSAPDASSEGRKRLVGGSCRNNERQRVGHDAEHERKLADRFAVDLRKGGLRACGLADDFGCFPCADTVERAQLTKPERGQAGRVAEAALHRVGQDFKRILEKIGAGGDFEGAAP